MKNTAVLTLAIISTILSLQSKPAEAGLLIGATAGDARNGAIVGAIIGATIFAGYGNATYTLPSGELNPHPIPLAYMAVFAGVGALLNIDASVNESDLSRAFKIKYPFLNNQEAVSALAHEAKNKVSRSSLSDPTAQNIFVRFNLQEINQALSGASISDEQLKQMVRDLE